MLNLYIKQREKALALIFYAFLAIAACLLWIQETRALEVTCDKNEIPINTEVIITCNANIEQNISWNWDPAGLAYFGLTPNTSCNVLSSNPTPNNVYGSDWVTNVDVFTLTIKCTETTNPNFNLAVYNVTNFAENDHQAIPIVDADAEGKCNDIYNGKTLDPHVITELWNNDNQLPGLCDQGTTASFRNSGGNGTGPYIWMCKGSDDTINDDDDYCSAYSTAADQNGPSFTCTVQNIDIDTPTNFHCDEDHGYSVWWRLQNLYNCDGGAVGEFKASDLYDKIFYTNLNCAITMLGDRTLRIVSGDKNDTETISITDPEVCSIYHTEKCTTKATCEDNNGTWCALNNTCSVDGNGCGLTITCPEPPIYEGTTFQCTSDSAANWTLTDTSVNSDPTCTGTNNSKKINCSTDYTFDSENITFTATSTLDQNKTASKSVQIQEIDETAISISCEPDPVAPGETIRCEEDTGKDVYWDFSSTNLSNCDSGNTPSDEKTCQIPEDHPDELVDVEASNDDENYNSDTTSFEIKIPDPTQIEITCTPTVAQGGIVTCTEDNDLSVNWSFNPSINCTTGESKQVNCTIPYTQTPWSITVTASKTDYATGSTNFAVTEKIRNDYIITCDSEKLTNKSFTCSATCGNTAESVTWGPSQCNTWPSSSTSCTFTNAGSQTITATPTKDSSSCQLTNYTIQIEQSDPAEIVCTGPFRIDESFACTVTCEEEAVDGTWSISSAGESSCNSTYGSSNQCKTDVSATVNVTGAGHCSSASAAISLTYYDLSLNCNPTTVHSTGNETFTCTATGGDEEYTWIYPSIVQEKTGSTDANKTFSIQLPSNSAYPTNGKVTVKVQDNHNHSKDVTISLLSPGIYVEDIYKIGNAAIQVGSTEDIYLQLNAVGGIDDIHTIQAKLVKGDCNNSADCADKQVFSVVTENPELSDTEETGSGSELRYNLLYKLPILVPDYEELTNWDYTYVVTIYDVNNQQTTAFLSTYIGALAAGDINGDQSVDILDIVKTVMFYLNPSMTIKASELSAIDFNNNGKIDLTDVITVIQEAMKE